jgi:hypothetical protein
MGKIAVSLAKSPNAWAKLLVSFFPAKSPILNFTINCDVDGSRTAVHNQLFANGGKK